MHLAGWQPEALHRVLSERHFNTTLTRREYAVLDFAELVRAVMGVDGRLAAAVVDHDRCAIRLAARELDRLERLPFAGYVSDPCDGRSQGTTAMMDSLANLAGDSQPKKSQPSGARPR